MSDPGSKTITTPRHTVEYCKAMAGMWRAMSIDPNHLEHVRLDCIKVAEQWEAEANADRS